MGPLADLLANIRDEQLVLGAQVELGCDQPEWRGLDFVVLAPSRDTVIQTTFALAGDVADIALLDAVLAVFAVQGDVQDEIEGPEALAAPWWPGFWLACCGVWARAALSEIATNRAAKYRTICHRPPSIERTELRYRVTRNLLTIRAPPPPVGVSLPTDLAPIALSLSPGSCARSRMGNPRIGRK